MITWVYGWLGFAFLACGGGQRGFLEGGASVGEIGDRGSGRRTLKRLSMSAMACSVRCDLWIVGG